MCQQSEVRHAGTHAIQCPTDFETILTGTLRTASGSHARSLPTKPRESRSRVRPCARRRIPQKRRSWITKRPWTITTKGCMVPSSAYPQSRGFCFKTSGAPKHFRPIPWTSKCHGNHDPWILQKKGSPFSPFGQELSPTNPSCIHTWNQPFTS